MKIRMFTRMKIPAILLAVVMVLASCGVDSAGTPTGAGGSGFSNIFDSLQQPKDAEQTYAPKETESADALTDGQPTMPSSAPPSAATSPPAVTPPSAATSPPAATPPPTTTPPPSVVSNAISFPYQFSAVDLYGNAVTDGTLGEKEVFLVHLWATWCPPCIVEMPDFPELMDMYGDRVGFIALLTDYDTNLSGAINIVQSSGISDSFIMINAYEQSVEPLLALLESGFVPTTVLISKHGISEQIVGAHGMGYAAFIDELLG